MSLAIAHGMMKRRKMAKGGRCMAHGEYACPMCDGGKMEAGGDVQLNKEEQRSGYMPHKYAKGGEIRQKYEADEDKESGFLGGEKATGFEEMPEEDELSNPRAKSKDDLEFNQHGDEEEGPMGSEEDSEDHYERLVDHDVENQDDGPEEDMVGKIMKQRLKTFSKGGQVANRTGERAGREMNQFDYLVKHDPDMEFSESEANEGDDLDSRQEQEDRNDIVAMIMKQRRLKDRLPKIR